MMMLTMPTPTVPKQPESEAAHAVWEYSAVTNYTDAKNLKGGAKKAVDYNQD